MSSFKILKSDDDLKEIIKAAFDTELDIAGDWGYTKKSATVIQSTTTPLSQFEHMFASMRAYVEMNMTLEKEARYGSINVNTKKTEEIKEKNRYFHKITYEVTAMKEDIYAAFIDAYKEGYGKESFDLSSHFEARKKETLYREVTHWFEISQIS